MNKIHLSRHFSKIQRLSEIRTKIIMRRIDSIKSFFFSHAIFMHLRTQKPKVYKLYVVPFLSNKEIEKWSST